jgi:hypothetical protein
VKDFFFQVSNLLAHVALFIYRKYFFLSFFSIREQLIQMEQTLKKVTEEKETLEMRIEQRHLQVQS